jgi:hypothetical protein
MQHSTFLLVIQEVMSLTLGPEVLLGPVQNLQQNAKKFCAFWGPGSSVGMATRLQVGDRGSIPGGG